MSFSKSFHHLALNVWRYKTDPVVTPAPLQKFTGVPGIDPRAIGKLLLNAWSAEYALRITPVVNDEQYLQSSLHWTFPQAYYSVLFSARAFLSVQGEPTSREDKIGRCIANLVVKGFYPTGLGYYVYGQPQNYRLNRLASHDQVVIDFLTQTRDNQITKLRNEIQNNPKTALRSPKTGDILKKFSLEQYKQLSKQIGYTCYFDLIKRLRISSTNRDIERMDLGEINVPAFHADLVTIVEHLNTIHEQYVARALGQTAYRQLINDLPSYLRESFLNERLPQILHHETAGTHS